ncbi:MAG: hypothetical protein HeimC3_15570 [Candidatus Heimdallarchaeota archaeon LC_3]|nr:MAG: hypothetical protein HeimC3_15570 [Candidatus Heimdallarchaeota archaeon LC_3]
MPKTGVISVRMKNEIMIEIQKYSEILQIRPSTIIALLVEDYLELWVKEQSERAFKKIWMKD